MCELYTPAPLTPSLSPPSLPFVHSCSATAVPKPKRRASAGVRGRDVPTPVSSPCGATPLSAHRTLSLRCARAAAARRRRAQAWLDTESDYRLKSQKEQDASQGSQYAAQKYEKWAVRSRATPRFAVRAASPVGVCPCV